MNLGGPTGYETHCTVGLVTKGPPFCSSEHACFFNTVWHETLHCSMSLFSMIASTAASVDLHNSLCKGSRNFEKLQKTTASRPEGVTKELLWQTLAIPPKNFYHGGSHWIPCGSCDDIGDPNGAKCIFACFILEVEPS